MTETLTRLEKNHCIVTQSSGCRALSLDISVGGGGGGGGRGAGGRVREDGAHAGCPRGAGGRGLGGCSGLGAGRYLHRHALQFNDHIITNRLEIFFLFIFFFFMEVQRDNSCALYSPGSHSPPHPAPLSSLSSTSSITNATITRARSVTDCCVVVTVVHVCTIVLFLYMIKALHA